MDFKDSMIARTFIYFKNYLYLELVGSGEKNSYWGNVPFVSQKYLCFHLLNKNTVVRTEYRWEKLSKKYNNLQNSSC